MQQRGWTFEPVLQHSQVPEPRTVGELRDFRESFGYGLYTTLDFVDTSGREAADRNNEYHESLGADEQAVYRRDLNGDVSGEGEAPVAGSCEALAEGALEVPGTDQAVMTEMRNLYQAAQLSAEFLSAVDDWRACLASRGYEIDREAHPVDLVDELAFADAQPQELTDFELAIAVADFECDLTTKMPVLHRLETEIVQELVEKYPEWGS
ncbi:MAG TPA: hypothetical protein VJA46_05755 [Acidimicrobiia bacterium]|nr:hypothetical protein [Acidimicrobiia bacterium]